ncbi:acyltransferase family protein [Stenomitos frigidus]|uniref:Acyltransferase n=1 Tax=Stenomitos frigidus ULC18 TaxID=2107698 RepID=A0A2T1E2A4_9CYAN|nr:acyltransferase [Stenomitos frigidus]PSB26868.1 acyltransferase [Stenomitos frigidus ULC18]
MVNSKMLRSPRLAWLEGIRIAAAVLLLLYHAQLLFTGYAYTPQPTGLADNLRQLVTPVEGAADPGLLLRLLGIPAWFGFQFVDVFVLISGFSLVLSLKGKPLVVGSFLKRRALRILWPFWTVAWLSYPVLWAIGVATHSYIPSLWHTFAGATFPLLFDYSGELLLATSGPWWFVPLILSFALIFPFLWHLLQRWGATNLVLISTLLTVAYRALAVYKFDGHPTYVILDTPTDWHPFLIFLAKLSTFVLGMVVAQLYVQGKGPIFWKSERALLLGVPVYTLGFVCQFYRAGWVFVDLLLPIGLTLCCMVLFRAIAQPRPIATLLTWLGAHSYTYFLIHNFVVDRTIRLVVQDDLSLYYWLLPVMVLGTLILAVLADYASPLLQRLVGALLRDLDYVLTPTTVRHRRLWNPRMGDPVLYKGNVGWTVLKVEKLLDERAFFLCQISDGQRSLWVNEDDLEPAVTLSHAGEVSKNSAFF